jgi:serpin B
MMEQEHFFFYSEGVGYQAVELFYKGFKLSMLILLPEIGSYKDFEQSLTSEQVASIISDLEFTKVQLAMPKFAYESSFSLRQTLIELGMPDALQLGIANFSGMDGTQSLFISDVVHKAFVSVDEFGTEAAAATGIPGGGSAPPTTVVEVTIDRPFMFMIRDIQTEAILFIGRVLDPSGS